MLTEHYAREIILFDQACLKWWLFSLGCKTGSSGKRWSKYEGFIYSGDCDLTQHRVLLCWSGDCGFTQHRRWLWLYCCVGLGDRAARPGGQEPVARPGGDIDGGSDEDPAHLRHGPSRNDQPGAVPWWVSLSGVHLVSPLKPYMHCFVSAFEFSSVQFKMVFMRSEMPICALPSLPEFTSASPLKRFQCSSDRRWPSLVLSRKIV